jgi:hypothetical protein
MFFLGGFFGHGHPGELFQPGMQLVEPQFFNQMTTLHAPGDDVRRGHAELCRPGQLDDPDDDRRAGHGAAAHEQLELLDPAAAFTLMLATLFMEAVPRPSAGRCIRRWFCRQATLFRS